MMLTWSDLIKSDSDVLNNQYYLTIKSRNFQNPEIWSILYRSNGKIQTNQTDLTYQLRQRNETKR